MNMTVFLPIMQVKTLQNKAVCIFVLSFFKILSMISCEQSAGNVHFRLDQRG